MTVPVQVPEISYVEDGATTAFPVPWRYRTPSDLYAMRVFADGSEEQLVYGTAYSATAGDTAAGGTLNVTAPAVSGTKLRIWRETERRQSTKYETTAEFSAKSHEDALDEQVMRSQEQDVELSRTAKVPRGEAGVAIPRLDTRRDRLAIFDDEGGFAVMPGTAVAVTLDSEGKPTGQPITEILTGLGATIYDDGLWPGDETVTDDGMWG